MAEKNLSVLYKSQWDSDVTGSNNDCGPTSLSMVLGYNGKTISTNEVTKETGAGTGFSNFTQLKSVASKYGFTSLIERNQTVTRLKQLLDQGIPVIVVVHYGYLSSRQDQNFKGAHIFVVVGYRDDGYFVNDPDFFANFRPDGDHHFYKKDEFELAWKQSTEDGNQSNTLFFIVPTNAPNPIPVDEYGKKIKEYLISVGYTDVEAHLDVIKAMYQSDVKLKSGNYITKEESNKTVNEAKEFQQAVFNKEKENFETLKKEEVEQAVKDALKTNNESWQIQVQDYVKVKDSSEYKLGLFIFKVLNLFRLNKEVKI